MDIFLNSMLARQKQANWQSLWEVMHGLAVRAAEEVSFLDGPLWECRLLARKSTHHWSWDDRGHPATTVSRRILCLVQFYNTSYFKCCCFAEPVHVVVNCSLQCRACLQIGKPQHHGPTTTIARLVPDFRVPQFSFLLTRTHPTKTIPAMTHFSKHHAQTCTNHLHTSIWACVRRAYTPKHW